MWKHVFILVYSCTFPVQLHSPSLKWEWLEGLYFRQKDVNPYWPPAECSCSVSRWKLEALPRTAWHLTSATMLWGSCWWQSVFWLIHTACLALSRHGTKQITYNEELWSPSEFHATQILDFFRIKDANFVCPLFWCGAGSITCTWFVVLCLFFIYCVLAGH